MYQTITLIGGLNESANSCASLVTGTSNPSTTPYFSLCSNIVDAFIMSRLLIGPMLIAEYLTFWLRKYSNRASSEPSVEAWTYTPSECSFILFRACDISLENVLAKMRLKKEITSQVNLWNIRLRRPYAQYRAVNRLMPCPFRHRVRQFWFPSRLLPLKGWTFYSFKLILRKKINYSRSWLE